LSARAQTMLWIAQRASAAVLALCVIVHLGMILYAVRGGISAAEILGRTRGNAGWTVFYSLFVLACAVHAPIGLRTVLREWAAWRGRGCDTAMWLFAALLAWAGMRAVLAVTGAVTA
jgi:fumarate reductase subunit C